jgi:GT2 family glycosyltransferase
MISVICVYNNQEILRDYLLKGLQDQTSGYDSVLIDNTSKRFLSAATALNYGASQARGDYLMFIHQDMVLLSPTWLEDAERIMASLPSLGIAGMAGVSDKLKELSTNLKQGIPPLPAAARTVDRLMEVQTLDECLVLIPKAVFDECKFDEDVCDGWHLYSVDYCLSIKNLDYKVFVLPLPGYHRSPGYSMSRGYYTTLKRVLEKHKGRYPIIYTTMGFWNTSRSVYLNRIDQKILKAIRYGMKMKRIALRRLSLHQGRN